MVRETANEKMSSDFQKPCIVQSLADHTHTVIFLHGRGSNGKEIADAFSESKFGAENAETLFSAFPTVRWVFPTAKTTFSTVFKEEITEWFDIYSLTNPSEKEELQLPGLRSSVVYLREVLTSEVKLLDGDASRLVLAGISQGEATVLILLLLRDYEYGGFIGYSGWMPLSKNFKDIEGSGNTIPVSSILATLLNLPVEGEGERSCPDASRTPVLIGHGRDDAYVAVDLGRQVIQTLHKFGYRELSWKEYEEAEQEGHWFKEPEAFVDIAAFIAKIVNAVSISN